MLKYFVGIDLSDKEHNLMLNSYVEMKGDENLTLREAQDELDRKRT